MLPSDAKFVNSIQPSSSSAANPLWNEKQVLHDDGLSRSTKEKNPVIESAKFVFDRTDLVSLDERSVKNAAKYIRVHARSSDWIFLISALNFSFWSDKEGSADGERTRFGVEWRSGWGSDERRVWTGYWSLVAAVNRALENGIPITDPAFYASAERCPDSTIAAVFKPAPQSTEGIPLLKERIAIIREVGTILCARKYGGPGCGTALQLVHMVTETFPSFRDETYFEGRKVFFWKRAQILIAETWAAFHPPAPRALHPLFPGGVHALTMFADYRVPQLLHHLGILVDALAPGSREELGIRAASILAVEASREEEEESGGVSSVLIDFYLWDLAKRIECGQEAVEHITTQEMLPAHRTRSIWY
ncbi:hypothetical protein DFH11DRAFT_1688975 [Phellopilus nigrolimitatus]|nr:hypothetical protein DFH11DRAFT_1688975 [Phellopilus nigrolimitatus]